MPHEYVHSWNGKYRRPSDLATKDYSTPMQDSLLWVYEGLTEYLGYVLAARSGMQSSQYARFNLALRAGLVASQNGREWRNLQDTTNTEILTNGRTRPLKWHSWQRGTDYYSEGSLIWLDIDTIIRQRSKGKRSLDDFSADFFGMHQGGDALLFTYTLDDLIQILNNVEPFDWRAYFSQRLLSHNSPSLEGITRSGYELVFTEKSSELQKRYLKGWEQDDFYFSLGLMVGKEGRLTDVVWNSPAFLAGLAPGMSLIAVNGESYAATSLSEAIIQAKNGNPIQLILKSGNYYRTVTLNYRGGLRFPQLRKIDPSPLLDRIFSPK